MIPVEPVRSFLPAAMSEEFLPSKTQRKKDDHALQELGEHLVAMDAGTLERLGLTERLRDAVLEARDISKFGARRRQMQYIGRLMREDADVDTIRRQVESRRGKSIEDAARLHQTERWRMRLLEDDAALGELLTRHPGADAQRLRTLIRNTRSEYAAGKAPKHYRELFQLLRGILDGPDSPPSHRDPEGFGSDKNE